MKHLMRCVCVVLLGVLARAEEVPITILHTTDLHAHVWPTTDYDGKENVGGVARIATVVKQIRGSTPNTLLVDAGDTIQGDPIGFHTDGQVMIKYLNYMKYDAWVLGNHEFDWGKDKLAQCLANTRIPVLAANVKWFEYPPAKENQLQKTLMRVDILPYRLVEVGGVKIAIIGLTTPGIPNWSRPWLINGLQFEVPVEALKRVIPEVKGRGAQILILVTHQGFREGGDDHANQLNAVAREFPELDAIIGGHSHRLFSEHKINGVLYTQAAYHGTYLGRLDLVYDTTAKKMKRRKATTIPMDASVEFDKEFLRLISTELDAEKKVAAEMIGEAAGEFAVGRRNHETPIHNLLCGAITDAVKAKGIEVDAVFHSLLSSKAGLAQGPIRVRDVWRIVPYENTLGVAELLPTELKEIMEESAALWGGQGQEFRGLYGLKLKLKVTAPVNTRVLSITDRNGKELDPTKRIKVAFNSYDLASAGKRFTKLREICERPTSNLKEIDVQTRQAVIDYIRTRKRITPETFGWWETSASSR